MFRKVIKISFEYSKPRKLFIPLSLFHDRKIYQCNQAEMLDFSLFLPLYLTAHSLCQLKLER